MNLDLESENITPPVSPILGYSGSQDEQSLIDSGVIYCLNCKGVLKRNDHSFSPESYILRREVINALDNFADPTFSSEGCEPRLIKCFNGNLFDPLDKDQLKLMVAICRKTVSSLEILSESANSYNARNYDVNITAVASDDPDEPCNQNPWVLRKRVCQFLNFIVRQLKYYRVAWKTEDWQKMFIGLKKSLGSTKEWSSVLKSHCGFRGGNECSSATYHFFHLQLELRWCLLLIFGLNEAVIQWVLDDLIHLSWFSYSKEGNVSLEEKQAFNCACIKEMWVMIRLLLDNLKPMEKPFWTFYGEAIKRISSLLDAFFPIWLTANLADSGNYTVAGIYTSVREKEGSLAKESNDGYEFLRGAYKDWVNKGGKSTEVLKLSLEFLKQWGGDPEIIVSLWMQFASRLDKGSDLLSNFQSYSSIDSWLSLVYKLCEEDGDVSVQKSSRSIGVDDSYLDSNKDPFCHLIRLVGIYAGSCNEKDIRRLKSNICMKLNRSNTNDFGELGIFRVSSLFLVLIKAISAEKEAVSWCERLQDTFTFNKLKNTPGRRKATLRAYSTMLILLLQKKVDMRNVQNIVPPYMKIVDELLCDSSSALGEPSKKDLIMIYIDLLDNLPKYTPNLSPDQNLGRPSLISTNFLMWLSKCGPNYVVRTARVLSNITNWVLTCIKSQIDSVYGVTASSLAKSPSEAKDFLVKMQDKCLPYIKSCVTQSSNRIPATDMKPVADLAGDITLLNIKLYENSKSQEELFDLFAICERTCPVVSQFYVERLFKHKDFLEHCFTQVKWAKVWIRLVALNCPVPDELTELVLGTDFASTSNSELLDEFCKREWSKEEIKQIVGQLTSLLEGIMKGSYIKDQGLVESEKIISSVISTCATLLTKVRFDLLFVRGLDTSIAHQFLTLLVPASWPGLPPWERWSPTVLKSVEVVLFDIFQQVVSQVGYAQDGFLRRKTDEIVTLAVFGFIKEPDDVDKDIHPAFRILNFCEDNQITVVLNEVLPKVITGDTVLKSEKFSQLFLRAVSMFRLKRFPTLVLRFGTGIIRTYLLYPNMQKAIKAQCLNSIIYCVLFGSGPFFRELLLNAFENAFRTEFPFGSRRCFDLCTAIARCNPADRLKKEHIGSFLKNDLLPILKKNVELAEQRRGVGYDTSLRAPYESLEASLKNVNVNAD